MCSQGTYEIRRTTNNHARQQASFDNMYSCVRVCVCVSCALELNVSLRYVMARGTSTITDSKRALLRSVETSDGATQSILLPTNIRQIVRRVHFFRFFQLPG